MGEPDGIVREFLLESFENLEQADTDLVALETQPGDRALLDRVFRVIHTVKGTCGFLGFTRLESLTHVGEGLLSKLRDGDLPFTPEVADVLLELMDAVRRILTAIDRTSEEGPGDDSDLVARLVELRDAGAGEAPPRPKRGRRGRKKAPAEAAAPPRDAPAPAEGPPGVQGGAEVATRQSEDVAEPAAGSPAMVAATVTEANVRVDVRLLDELMDLVGELVLTRNELLRQSASEMAGTVGAALQHLNLVTSELQEGIMKTRMQPVGKIWGKFPRMVRDVASSCGKLVRLEMEGQDTELDRSLIEAIKDPLTHLVRNAIDHGIEGPADREAAGKPETGMLWLRAFPEGGQVNIHISDDGAGMDPTKIASRAVAQGLVTADQAVRMSPQESLNLIFHAGFSTADAVTSLSGRGVGMDVVKTNIERVNGLVDLESVVGQGTTVKIKIPLTLAIIPALIVTTAEERFAIPQSSVLELVRLMGSEVSAAIEKIHGAPVYRLRGKLLPIVELRRELDLIGTGGPEAGSMTIVVLQADERQFGLLVDGVIDSQEIVVKPLGELLERIPVFVGATIMGDGRVALILDVLGLAQRAHVISEEHQRALAEELAAAPDAGRVERLLLCRGVDEGRLAIPLSRVARLETLPRDSLELVGGQRVVQYRGDILPLVDLVASLPERRQRPRAPQEGQEPEMLNVVVYSFDGQQVGLLVPGIVDIVEEVITVRRPGSREGVNQCAVVRGRVTELLDIEGIVARAQPVLDGRSDHSGAEA